MPKTLEELAMMLAERDGLTFEEEMLFIRETARDLEYAFYNGALNTAEDILREDLGLEPDYLELFII